MGSQSDFGPPREEPGRICIVRGGSGFAGVRKDRGGRWIDGTIVRSYEILFWVHRAGDWAAHVFSKIVLCTLLLEKVLQTGGLSFIIVMFTHRNPGSSGK
jgi:hypothetical protein